MSNNNEPRGVISANELYTVQQLKRRLMFDDATLRGLRRKGLRCIRVGRRVYYSGRQVMEFFEELSTDERSSKS